MAEPSDPPIVVNVDAAEEKPWTHGEFTKSFDMELTPALRAKAGALCMTRTRVPPGRIANPFHTHQVDDEIFFVLEGTGVLRYGDEILPLRAGDAIACPAGTGKAHQLANTGDTDLVYLSIGKNDPNEVCTYPDSGKIMVRSLEKIGRLARADYFDGEPEPPPVFALAAKAKPPKRS